MYFSNAIVDVVFALSEEHHFDDETFQGGRDVITSGTHQTLFPIYCISFCLKCFSFSQCKFWHIEIIYGDLCPLLSVRCDEGGESQTWFLWMDQSIAIQETVCSLIFYKEIPSTDKTRFPTGKHTREQNKFGQLGRICCISIRHNGAFIFISAAHCYLSLDQEYIFIFQLQLNLIFFLRYSIVEVCLLWKPVWSWRTLLQGDGLLDESVIPCRWGLFSLFGGWMVLLFWRQE